MVKYFKILRNNHIINRLIAIVIKFLQLLRFTSKWPIKGIVNINILGEKIKFYSDCDDYLISNIYYGKFNEEVEEIRFLKSHIKEPMVFVDIGAYNGLFSIALGKHFRESLIYSIEPNPSNFSRIKKNIYLNHLGNIHLYQLGLSNRKGFLDIYIPEDFSITTVSSYHKSFTINHSKTELINYRTMVNTLDSFCVSNKIVPSLLKIDVENHEYEVLSGAIETLTQFKPVIICEIFTRRFENNIDFQNQLPKIAGIEKILKELEYRFYLIENEKLIQIPSLNINNSSRNMLFLPI